MQLYLYWFSAYWIHQLLIEGYWYFQLYSGFVYFPLYFYQLCLLYFDILLLSIYTLSIAVNSLRVDPFIIIIMKTLYLSLIIFLVVKSALSRYYTYSSLLSVYLSPCITFNLSLSLNLKLISHRKHTVGSFKKSPLHSFMYLFLFWMLHYFIDI